MYNFKISDSRRPHYITDTSGFYVQQMKDAYAKATMIHEATEAGATMDFETRMLQCKESAHYIARNREVFYANQAKRTDAFHAMWLKNVQTEEKEQAIELAKLAQ